MTRYLFIIFAVMVLLQGCDNSEKRAKNEFLKFYPGSSELSFNDIKTNRFRVRAGFVDDKISIGFLYAINDLYNREDFVIVNVSPNNLNLQTIYFYNKGDGTVNLDKNRVMSSFVTLSNDGDVLCHTYGVLESDSLNNWVKITKYDEKTKELSGEFSVTYIKTRECATLSYPDTIRIRNGVFHTKIMN